jgi:hypothetical protein
MFKKLKSGIISVALADRALGQTRAMTTLLT